MQIGPEEPVAMSIRMPSSGDGPRCRTEWMDAPRGILFDIGHVNGRQRRGRRNLSTGEKPRDLGREPTADLFSASESEQHSDFDIDPVRVDGRRTSSSSEPQTVRFLSFFPGLLRRAPSPASVSVRQELFRGINSAPGMGRCCAG